MAIAFTNVSICGFTNKFHRNGLFPGPASEKHRYVKNGSILRFFGLPANKIVWAYCGHRKKKWNAFLGEARHHLVNNLIIKGLC